MLKQSTVANSLILIRESFTSLLPIVLVMNMLVLLSGLTGLLSSWGVTGISAFNGGEVTRLYHFLIPLFLNLSLSTLLAKDKELDQIGTLLIAMVCFFRAAGFLGITDSADLVSRHGSILTSVPCTWLAVSLLHTFSKLPSTLLADQHTDISPRLKTTLNLIIPGLLTVLCFEVIGYVMALLIAASIPTQIAQYFPNIQALNAIQELILYKSVSLLTWFLGLHGEHAAEGLFHLLSATPTGAGTPIQLRTFHNIFMNIGGSGSTFVIPFLILFSQQAQPFKSIARFGLPFSFFNVNEILLFGLPILLNPTFFIPFLLAPFVNMAIALAAVQMGAFSITIDHTHWMSVPLYSAYVATNHSINAVITQVICIVVDGCIYLPFLIIANRQHQAQQHLRQLFGEDAYGLINEEIDRRQESIFTNRQQSFLNSMSATQKVLLQLQGGEFILYFQPKFETTSLQIVGLEALLRFKDYEGKISPPTFLLTLYEQGLSHVIDAKVVDLVFEQVLKWQHLDIGVPPIAINFDKDFLLDVQSVDKFIARAKRYNTFFYIEITEHTYTVEITALASVIKKLRSAGHRISIDDFGAGYSSLTTLLDLEADEIKLDRQLAIAPSKESSRGKILLASSVQLCHDLGFSIVAEGVETEEQMQAVRRCGVDTIQGYYLGKPMSASQISEIF